MSGYRLGSAQRTRTLGYRLAQVALAFLLVDVILVLAFFGAVVAQDLGRAVGVGARPAPIVAPKLPKAWWRDAPLAPQADLQKLWDSAAPMKIPVCAWDEVCPPYPDKGQPEAQAWWEEHYGSGRKR